MRCGRNLTARTASICPLPRLGIGGQHAVFIMAGAGVKNGVHLKGQVRQVDVAPTISYLLGFDVPRDTEGGRRLRGTPGRPLRCAGHRCTTPPNAHDANQNSDQEGYHDQVYHVPISIVQHNACGQRCQRLDAKDGKIIGRLGLEALYRSVALRQQQCRTNK